MPTVKDPKTGKKKKLPYPGQPGYSPDLPGMPKGMPEAPAPKGKKKKGLPPQFLAKKPKKKAPGVAKKGKGSY